MKAKPLKLLVGKADALAPRLKALHLSTHFCRPIVMRTPRGMTVSAAYAFPQIYYCLLLLLALNQTIPL
jgi:hypothetical protein